LEAVNRIPEAIKVWKSLLRRGVDALAYDACGEGKVLARWLLADCNYRVGAAYVALGKRKLGVKYFITHIQERQAGAKSIYSLREVKAELAAALRTD
jgi:hypothetical protein